MLAARVEQKNGATAWTEGGRLVSWLTLGGYSSGGNDKKPEGAAHADFLGSGKY
jgi:hypothetical protein